MTDQTKLDAAVRSFEMALAADRLAHGYLVVGSLRDEALPFAREVLMRLFCRGTGPRPCRTCPGCRQVEERRHADIVWIEPEKKSRVVGIDRVRELQRVVYQTSFEGGWKAVVLVSADRVGEEASNAFLKTLEEPPPRCLFLLLTDTPQAVMATIVSRCQRIVLSSEAELLPEPWRSELLGILGDPVPPDLSGVLLRSGRLERLLAELRKSIADKEEADAEAAGGEDVDEDTLQARIEARYRGLRTMIVRGMLMWYRDILMCVCGVGSETLCHPEREADLRRLAAGLAYGDALRNLQVIETMQRQFDRNMSPEGVLQGTFGALSV
jgi:DNA polymerase-3 subunit delta'